MSVPVGRIPGQRAARVRSDGWRGDYPYDRKSSDAATIEDYEREGRRFYGLAEGHPAARALELSSVFGILRENFTSARKPLTFVATRFLHASRRKLFGVAMG